MLFVLQYMLLAVLNPLVILKWLWLFQNGQVNLMAVSKPKQGFELAWAFQNGQINLLAI